MVEKITKLIGLLSVALIILGLFDLNSYYGKFNLPINDFLSNGEIILAFSQLNIYSLPNLIIVVSIVFLNTYFSLKKSKGINKVEEEGIELIEGTDKSKTNPKIIKYLLADLAVAIIFIVFGIISYKSCINSTFFDSSKIAFTGYLLWIGLYRLLEFGITIVTEIRDKFYFTEKQIQIVIPVLLILSLIISIHFTNSIKYNLIKKGVAEYDITIEFNNRRIESNNELKYIGNTDNYIFFYNRTNASTNIFSKSEINEMTLIKSSTELDKINNKKDLNMIEKDTMK